MLDSEPEISVFTYKDRSDFKSPTTANKTTGFGFYRSIDSYTVTCNVRHRAV